MATCPRNRQLLSHRGCPFVPRPIVGEGFLCSPLSTWPCAVGLPLGFGHLSLKSTESHTMLVCVYVSLCEICSRLHRSLFISQFISLLLICRFSGLLIFTYSPREMSRNHQIRLSTSEMSNPGWGRMGSRRDGGRLPEANHRVKNQSKLTQPGEKPALKNIKIFFFSSNELYQSREVSVH